MTPASAADADVASFQEQRCARCAARDSFDPHKPAKETSREIERITRGFRSIRRTIRRSVQLIEQSKDLLNRLPKS
jgi:hypothetical protein